MPARKRSTILVTGDLPMTETMKELGIDQLTEAQQIALALKIRECLGDARPSSQLTEAQRAELARRDTNPDIGLTWQQIRSSIESKQ